MMPMMLVFILLGLAVLANLVRAPVGIADFFGGGRADSWLLTVALFAAALIVAGHALQKRWDGVFIEGENRISLSRLQLVLWTILLISALMTAGMSNTAIAGVDAPLDISIEPEVWGLLGLGAFTAIAAPAIKKNRETAAGAKGPKTANTQQVAESVKAQDGLSAAPAFVGDVLVKASPRDARWLDIIRGDNDGSDAVDISKLQQLAITVTLIAIYGAGLWTDLSGVERFDKFPEVSAGFLGLLGLSHAAYLVDKQIAST